MILKENVPLLETISVATGGVVIVIELKPVIPKSFVNVTGCLKGKLTIFSKVIQLLFNKPIILYIFIHKLEDKTLNLLNNGCITFEKIANLLF